MDKFKKYQILKLSLIAALLVVAPLVPTSLRPTYLFFVFNLLIIVVGAEAGLFSFFFKAAEDNKPVVIIAPKPPGTTVACPDKEANGMISPEHSQKKAKVVEKSLSEKIGTVKVQKVKKCPSTPSLFFIGGGETDKEEVVEDDDEEEELGGISGQELFTRAETFIGDFYKQLKMQREESWKKIYGVYQKAF